MKCFLHIGLHKTGTTAIQKFSCEYNDYLFENGYNYPIVRENHSLMFISLYKDSKFKEDLKQYRLIGKIASLGLDNENYDLEKIIEEKRCENVIFSSEGIVVLTIDEIKRLKKDLSKYFDSITIIVYVREIFSWLSSYFSQYAKHGVSLKEFTKDTLNEFSIREKIEKFIKIFGKENVICKEFIKDKLHGNDSVIDFYDTIGLDVRDKRAYTIDNKKLSSEALHVLDSICSSSFWDSEFSNGKDNLYAYLKIIELFHGIGTTKYSFEILKPDFVYSYFKEDLQWLTDEFGIVFNRPENEEAQQLDKIKLMAIENISEILLDYVKSLQIKKSDFFDNLKEFSKILNDNKELPQKFYSITASWAIKFKFYQKALELLEESLTIYSGTAEIFNNLAFIYDQCGRGDEAEKSVRKAIELKETDASYYVLLGNLLKNKDDVYGSKKAYEKAVCLDSSIPAPHIQLSLIYDKEGHLDEAIEEVNKAISLSENNSFFYFQLGCLLRKRKNFEDSRLAFENSIRLDSSLAGPHFQLSLVCEELGDISSAIDEAKAGLKIKPDNEYFKHRMEKLLN
jgi:tetratricopeptide (TPR) repeat protein